MCLLNQRVGKLIPKGIDRLFLYYVVHSRHFLLSMIEMAVGGAQDNLGKPDITGYSCFIPRKSAEQRAITETLSDVDRLLGALETLSRQEGGLSNKLPCTNSSPVRPACRASAGRGPTKRLTELAAITHGAITAFNVLQPTQDEGLPLIQEQYQFIVRSATVERIDTRIGPDRQARRFLIPGEGDIGTILHVRAPVGARRSVRVKDATLQDRGDMLD